MIKWFNNRNNIIKYFICIFLLLLLLLLFRVIFLSDYNYKNDIKNVQTVEKRLINSENNNYKVYVNYPKFHNINIDKIISNYIYKYINKFKNEAIKLEYLCTLSINYEYYTTDKYLNIYFTIDNSLNKKDKYKNLIINIDNYKISKITDIYEKDKITNKINSLVKFKYSTYIYEKIINKDINDFAYKINNDEMNVYMNIDDTNIAYIPYVTFSIIDDINDEEYSIDPTKKLVALTFDDGPSEYTVDFIETLKLNNSKATFFMLGNRMKYKQEIVKMVYLSGNEIGSHSYSHKNLTRISKEKILREMNSVTILYNQITGDNIKYLRLPYGSVNSIVRKLTPFPLIEWSIDSKDWLYRNAEKEAKYVLDKIYDGAIILMHDVYPQTLEAIKILIPELKAIGYELVTISDLAKYKNYELSIGKVTREIK